MDIVRNILTYILIFLIILLACIIRFVVKFNKDIRRVNRNFIWSKNWQESLYWKSELHALYWSFIPGITPKRVKRICDWLVEEEESFEEEKECDIMKMMLPSFLGIALCAVCLAGGTYAWFTASTSTPTQMIQTANFGVTAVVTKEGDDSGAEVVANDGLYTLEDGATYKITLTATGNASTGYCVIKTDTMTGTDAGWHTGQFSLEETANDFIFHLKVEQETTITIQAQWGTSTKNLSNDNLKPDIERDGSYCYDGSSLTDLKNESSVSTNNVTVTDTTNSADTVTTEGNSNTDNETNSDSDENSGDQTDATSAEN